MREVEGEMGLPGLQRLMETCQRHGLFLKTLPPEETSPNSGEVFLGHPFDPVLAALYRKLSAAMLGDFQLYSWGSGEGQLASLNEGMRSFGEEPYVSVVLFGQLSMMAYYLATVPSLADARGTQPVVFIDAYERKRVLPVASSVDALFTTFSMYLERAVMTEEYAAERRIALHFPTSVPDLVASDRPLVGALSAGHFKRLMRDDNESQEWISALTQGAS
jgi:hypothetical protein